MENCFFTFNSRQTHPQLSTSGGFEKGSFVPDIPSSWLKVHTARIRTLADLPGPC
jgi:hypothetical protein